MECISTFLWIGFRSATWQAMTGFQMMVSSIGFWRRETSRWARESGNNLLGGAPNFLGKKFRGTEKNFKGDTPKQYFYVECNTWCFWEGVLESDFWLEAFILLPATSDSRKGTKPSSYCLFLIRKLAHYRSCLEGTFEGLNEQICAHFLMRYLDKYLMLVLFYY